MSNLTYWQKLKDPRWQKKRLAIFERDAFSCAHCGDSENTLHVHHEFYQAGLDPWDYEDSSLLTLCETCHNEITGLNREPGILLCNPINRDTFWKIRDLLIEKNVQPVDLYFAICKFPL